MLTVFKIMHQNVTTALVPDKFKIFERVVRITFEKIKVITVADSKIYKIKTVT